jgi:hypothetical protein
MEIIYSILDSDVILTKHFKLNELTLERTNLSNEEDLLQVGVRLLAEGHQVPAHKHLVSSPVSIQTIQEVWILFSGFLTANIYDLDNSFVGTIEVNSGDIVIYQNGGHSLLNHSQQSALYEIKSGPYLGLSKDKENI